MDIAKDPNNSKTMLAEWFNANKKYEEARQLTYVEFPQKRCWIEDKKNGKRENMVSKSEEYIMLTQLKENAFTCVCF
jgi:hypothetical protein